jgi:hypothetical protein
MKKYIAILVFLSFFATVSTTFAVTQITVTPQYYTPLEPLPGAPPINQNSSGLGTYLNSWYKILISISGMFAVLMLVIAGVRYMGSSVPGVMKMAKEQAWAAVFGLVLLAASWLILNTINPQLLKFNLTPPTPSTNQNTPAK